MPLKPKYKEKPDDKVWDMISYANITINDFIVMDYAEMPITHSGNIFPKYGIKSHLIILN